MPRHPEGRVALTDAERSARKRRRQAAQEQRRLAALKAIASGAIPLNKVRQVAHAALESKQP